ncbi:fasciclin domain-containing protein [Aquimarina brevivitae]|uniref:Putative surface protein with fasciclin (FAS1) repeats n=1 Tax=Aquimarina brevivitae TaxID=323412 RepID=A0A4Q7PHA3_9FLAO|nr:fasciclin domain-containing protein [Aquimarina brevivitae]RZS99926.1 putative surface protein with fasciclin (FAS1) repeats [Aquimarina brevivitae]
MSIKKPFLGLLFSIPLLLISCNSEKKPKDAKVQDNRIAQHSEPTNTNHSVAKVIAVDKGFSTFSKWLSASGYDKKLAAKGPYTVFAPTNYAFENLYPGTTEKLMLPEHREKLTAILEYHIIPGLINENDIFKAIDDYGGSVKLKTLGGKKLIASRKHGNVYLIDEKGNGGKLITTNIEADNGIMHTIDDIMQPKQK